MPAPSLDPVTDTPRLLLVHAHPDDESILDGATMAAAVRSGVAVTLLTCTRGEGGEVMVPGLTHLYGDGPALARHRAGELAAAMAALGVTDHRFLTDPDGRPDEGGPHAGFTDSGMAGSASNRAPGSLWATDLLVSAAAVAAVVREVRPHVLITYDEHGGYGHPDHVAAHRAAMYGSQLAAAPWRPELGARWDVPKVYWSATPRSVALAGLARAGAGLAPGSLTDPVRAGDPAHWRSHPDPAAYPFVDDALVTTRIDASARLEAKKAALRAHATQLAVDGDRFALTNGIALPLSGVEWYRLVKGRAAPADGAGGLETDLFAGLGLAVGPGGPAAIAPEIAAASEPAAGPGAHPGPGAATPIPAAPTSAAAGYAGSGAERSGHQTAGRP